MDFVKKLIDNGSLEKEEYVKLLEACVCPQTGAAIREELAAEAVAIREHWYGNKVYTRGLIEYTNYCKNNCYYCGIRAGNTNVQRYRLTKKEIMDCCANGYELGFRTFVLQGGEDPYFTDEKMVEIIRGIREL